MLAWLCFATGLLFAVEADKAVAPKHVVIVLTDDLGFGSPGYQNDRIKSPTLDSLAAGGVKLHRHYVYR